MKTTILVTCFLSFFCLSLSAQVELTNMSISETNAKYVYMFSKNLLFLNNADPSKTYEVKLNDVNLTKTDFAQFDYTGPYSRENKFDIYENDVLIKTEVFPGKRPSDPEIRIGNLTRFSLKLLELLEEPIFTIFSYDTFIQDRFINGFTMTILGESGNVKMKFQPTSGSNFTPEQIEMIATLQSGDQLEINDLAYTDSAGISRKKNPFFITIL